MTKRALLLLLAITALAGGCSLPLDGAKCPCATGWTCCDDLRTCVRLDAVCPGGADAGGPSCLPGEDCPGDPPPEQPVGIVNLGVAQFPGGVIAPETDLIVSFPIVVDALNRDTTFRVLTASFLLGPPAARMETTALDEHDQPLDTLILPKTDQTSNSRIVKVRIKVPALPSGVAQAQANVVLSLSTPSNVASAPNSQANAPSSGQILFTVGTAAPPANAFPVNLESVASPGTFDGQYATIDFYSGTEDVTYIYLRADLTQMPVDETFTPEFQAGDDQWQLISGNQQLMPTPGDPRTPFVLYFNGVSQGPPTTLDVTVRGTDPRHVAQVRFTLQP